MFPENALVFMQQCSTLPAIPEARETIKTKQTSYCGLRLVATIDIIEVGFANTWKLNSLTMAV